MRPFYRWRRDADGLESAMEADAQADQSLRAAKVASAWARKTLEVNHLTERFFADLRHGGKL